MELLNLINPIYWIEKIYNWFERPKPEIRFEYSLSTENENNCCHLRINTSFENKPSWFFRIGVNNKGSQRIDECDVRVEKIEREQNNNSWKGVVNAPFFLHWANENTDNSRSVYSNSEVFCDVVFTVSGLDKLFIFHKAKHSGAGIPSYLGPGKYLFYIKLFGTNISPVERKIEIDFDGSWDKLKMKLADKKLIK